MGIFDKIVKTSTEVAEGVKAAEPTVQAVDATLKTLPDGGLKDWLTKNPVNFWKSIIQLIKGKRFQTGQYILGERFMDHILGMNVGRQQVPDEAVQQARYFFTIVFGVRINNSEDLDSLDSGVEAYYKRGLKDDIPRIAVERAVRLKKQYYPISSYNKGTWDPIHWEKEPLVAPIPAIGTHDTLSENDVGKLFNGPLPGGAEAKDGIINGDNAFRELLKSMGWKYENGKWIGPTPGDGTGPVPGDGGTGPLPGGGGVTTAGMSTMQMILLGGLAIGAFIMANRSKPRKRG